MVVGSLESSTDIAVIGAGPAGYHAAIRAAQLGKQVTLIEKEFEGGTCLNYGCIPSKALIHAASVKEKALGAKEFGIEFELKDVDFPKLVGWKDGVVKKLRDGLKFLFNKYKIEVIEGTATFKGIHELTIQTEGGVLELYADKIIIATGGKPAELKGFEFKGNIIDSKKALSLKKLPESLIVIGAGYIGLELGLFYAMMGTKVKIVEYSDRILSAMPSRVSEEVMKTLNKYNVELYLKSKAVKAEDRDGLKVTIEQGGQEKILIAEKLLVAVGVKPFSEELALENAGIKLNEKGFIKVNASMQTSVNSIYAIGDITNKALLAHKGFEEGVVAAEHACGKKRSFINQVIPAVVYTKPEIALVGLTEDEAKKERVEFIKGRADYKNLGKALTEKEEQGFCEVIADKKSHIILGMLIVGEQAGNIISEAVVAIEANLTLEDLSLSMHPHPTYGEIIQEACKKALGEGIHG